ncbi:SPOC domain-containing protein 1 [Microcaecilia unicolor]|uniref:SPOC domain-containing protein 1 n=1 Tax=Microcaecilia unicolor TaxID=1415580 RepID=A0A6P7ZN75_9AMPH|nr:SPOC domain-containing protein 1 [Microcaecilia unicolor]
MENLELLGIEGIPANTETKNINHSKEGNTPKRVLELKPSQQTESCNQVKGLSEEFSDTAQQSVLYRFSHFLGVDPSDDACPILSKIQDDVGAQKLDLVSPIEKNEKQSLPSSNMKINKQKKQIDKGTVWSAAPEHQFPEGLESDSLGDFPSCSILLRENSQDPTLNMSSVQPVVTAADSVAESETVSNKESSARKKSVFCPPMCFDPFVCMFPLNKIESGTGKLNCNESAVERPKITEAELPKQIPNLEANHLQPSLQSLSGCRVLGSASLEEATQKQPDAKEQDASDNQADGVSGDSSDSWCLTDITQNLQVIDVGDQVSQNGDSAVHHLLSSNPELVQANESGRATSRNGLYTVPAETGNVSLEVADTEEAHADVEMFLSFMSLGSDNTTGETGDSEIQEALTLGLLKQQTRDGNVFNVGETWMTNIVKDTDGAQSLVGAVCRLHGAITLGQQKLCRLEELEAVSHENESDLDAQTPYLDEASEGCDSISCNKKAKLLLRPYGASLLFKTTVKSALDTETQRIAKKKKETGEEKRMPRRSCFSSPKVVPVLTEEQLRETAVQTLYDILLKRVQESPDLDVQEETVRMVAGNVEREMFALFPSSDLRYRNKYRSLLFNLRDPKNTHLFRQVVLGEITPQCLVLMSPIELAPQELAEWRNKENKRALEIIEKEQQQTQKSQVIKLTHKGLIEIEQAPDQTFTLEDLAGSVLHESRVLGVEAESQCASDPRSSTVQHESHLLDSDCLICPGQISPHIQQRNKGRSRRKMAATLRRISTSPDPKRREARISDRVAPRTGIQQKLQVAALWEGFIQMFSIKKFGVKAYLVSGCDSLLCQALPTVIESRGCILPETVWEYVDHIWPAESKAMGLIRFNSTSSRDSQAYTMLYSYLNSKQRYGAVNSNKMEVYIIPLPAFQPVPSKLRSLGGPGLEATHSSLLLALILPQSSPMAPAANSSVSDKLRKRKAVMFQEQMMGKHQVSFPVQGFENNRRKQMLQTQFSCAPQSHFPGSGDFCPRIGTQDEEPLQLGEQDASMDCLDEILWDLVSEQRVTGKEEEPCHTEVFSGAVSPNMETVREFSALFSNPEQQLASESVAEDTSRSSLHDVLQSLGSSLLLMGQQYGFPPEEAPEAPQSMRLEGPPPVPSSCSLPGMLPSLPVNLLDCNNYTFTDPLQLNDLLHYFSYLDTVPSHCFPETPASVYPASHQPSSTVLPLSQHHGGNEVAAVSLIQSLYSLNSQIPHHPFRFQSLHDSAAVQGIIAGPACIPGGLWPPTAPSQERP